VGLRGLIGSLKNKYGKFHSGEVVIIRSGFTQIATPIDADNCNQLAAMKKERSISNPDFQSGQS
jgi:hypothetical protein